MSDAPLTIPVGGRWSLNFRRWGPIFALTLFLLALPFVLKNSFYTDVAIRIAINAILVIGLNLLVGYAGQISIGHAGFYGIGAYGSAVLTTRLGLQPLPSLILSALGASCVAWIVGRAILRLKGHYLAMATLGLGMIIAIIITNEVAWTGGPDGLSVGEFAVFGHSLSGEWQWYWVFAGMLIAVIILAQNLVDSPAGRALRALNGSDIAASVAGIHAGTFKLRVFVLSAAAAAVMGSLSAHYMGFITPSVADFSHSVQLITMVLVGGVASIWGSVFGAALLSLLPVLLAPFEGWETLLFGLVLVITVIFLPRGVVPTIAAAWPRKGR